MPDSVAANSTSVDRIAELAANPDAIRWAIDCCWVPGTGYCRDRFCSIECLFRAQREAEAKRIIRARQRRRRVQSTVVGRPARS
jgi:hypothetical protein